MNKSISAALLTVSVLSACAKVEALPHTATPQLLDEVRSGNAQLTCITIACSNTGSTAPSWQVT